ncbi:2'-5' RNA ligase family protein [Paenibacillus sp. NPDC056579]|uniref:2'-5' RNA ligase family protein n=1 Tax=unclassified Paenibacillus TaxID=185978 RepID=UPI001EF78D04|nr:2'-5' RNA ligase family protein [Paenibacillus sp. H1-7]
MYGISVFPSKEIEQFANHYRRRYDPHYPNIRPHLSLIRKEAWSEEQLQSIIGRITGALAGMKRSELHFNRFSTFYPVQNVIFMALSDPYPIQRLYDTIQGVLLPGEHTNKPAAFTPHLTVAQGLGNDELHDVLSSLRNTRLDLRCVVDSVSVLQQNKDGLWNELQTIALK